MLSLGEADSPNDHMIDQQILNERALAWLRKSLGKQVLPKK
jgi:hypothetical protein